MNKKLIQNTIHFVKTNLCHGESAHDWWHTYRVWKLAERIATQETCNPQIVTLGALLHDVSDAKLNGGDEDKAILMATEFLNQQHLTQPIIIGVLYIIEHISFRKSLTEEVELTPELAIVMDADRLDAIGAIGIARTFNYGGFKKRPIYNPDRKREKTLNYESYTKSEAPSIEHFYDKLLKLKAGMNTTYGKILAKERHYFMEQYLDQFYAEWEGKK